MLSRTELQSWQSHREYPSVSILAPTHRTAPSTQQDPIKVDNLVRKAIERLHGEFTKREAAAVIKNLQALVKKLDWEHLLDGLALFASKEKSGAVTLPFKVKPRVLIDETFATRDLVYSFNRAKPYRVLKLSHSPSVYDAWTTVLEEHTGKPFPMNHRGPGGASKLPGGQGINRSAVRDDAHRTFFRSFDEVVGTLQQANRLPLFVIGVERNLAFYKEVTRHADAIVGMLAGNHDETSPTALGKLIWPIVDAGYTVHRTDALVQLDSAVGAERSASGLDQVWTAAIASKCQTLLVEKDYKFPADLSPEGDKLLPYTAQGAQALDDAVDEVIERVMATGGEVFFYPAGDLDSHDKIAAVLRR